MRGKFRRNFQGSAGIYFGGKHGKVAHDHDFHLYVQVKFVFFLARISDLFGK